MKRRHFLQVASVGTYATLVVPSAMFSKSSKPKVMTVNGCIDKKQMGVTLPHEHIVVDFIGAAQIDTSVYNLEEMYETALPLLMKLKEFGCTTFIDCTPNYLGRSPLLLQQLSDATGLHIVTNTGYYGAVDHKYLPEHVKTETPQELANRWIKEWEEGVDGTNIRPGFMKLSVGNGPISDLQRKIIEAGALTHKATGLTIAVHTGGNGAVLEELNIIEQQGVHPSAFVWIHAQNEEDTAIHLELARKGAWVEFDGLFPFNYQLSEQKKQEYLNYLQMMKREKCLHRTLLSQDSGWYDANKPQGGRFLPFHLIFQDFLPLLRKEGFTKKEVNLLLKENPYQAFAVRKRLKT